MTTATDARLAGFVAAQDEVYDRVRRELAAGRKESHWIWFIFPQMAGLGSPDDRKFRSSMTLFAAVAPGEQIFRAALERFYGGEGDAATLRLLERSGGGAGE